MRRDGQKVPLAVKNMGGESEAAWRAILDDLTKRGLGKPELAIVDGAPGLEKALVSLWSDLPIQRCTVHKLRNLIAHAPKKLAEEIAADYSDMIYAADAATIAKKRKAFLAKWRVKCEAVATSLEEVGQAALHLHAAARGAVAQRAHHERHRAPARGIQAAHQDADRAALGRDRRHAVLGAARRRPDRGSRKVDGWRTLPLPLAKPLDLDP